MSVVVSRQPTFNPISTHRRVSNPRASSAPAAIAPGLIRIQGGTTKASPPSQRNSRSRQRKQQNRQSQDDTPPIPPSDTVRDSPQSTRGSATTEPAKVPSSTSKDRTSPKRGSQHPHGKQQPQQQRHHQSKKQALQKQPLVPSQHKSSPQSPTKARHQHVRRPPRFDLHDLSFSSADDSDDALAPVVPLSPIRPVTAPTTLAVEPAGRLARARRNKGKGTTVAPVADTDNGSDPVVPTLSSSIPIARNRRSGHARAATTSDPFLSRSVPVSSLPDWDLPPPSFGISSSSSGDITAADFHHPPLSASQLSPTPATPERRSQPPAPLPRAAAMSDNRFLVPWIETLDEEERSAALHASAPLVSRPARAGIPDSPAPRTPTRPARRHTRTASVPSMSSVHGFPSSPTTSASPRRYGGSPASSTEQVNKYANGRFQSAPAPTFLPMPTFEA